jgi:hypothetical protein
VAFGEAASAQVIKEKFIGESCGGGRGRFDGSVQ